MSNPLPVPPDYLTAARDGLVYAMERDGYTMPPGFKMQVRVMCVPVECKCKTGSVDVEAADAAV